MAGNAREDQGFVWRTSSYSTQAGGNCVEVGSMTSAAQVAVRDTKNRARGYFAVSLTTWATFVRSVTR